MSVRVSVILKRKGGDVVTVAPDASLSTAAAALTEHNIGALVVSADGRTVDGIVSERDIVRCVARFGPQCLEGPVSEVMSTEVLTCEPDSPVDDLMATMSGRRIRHMPVVDNGVLAGMISIGDVVKSRLDQLELQAEALERYITGSMS